MHILNSPAILIAVQCLYTPKLIINQRFCSMLKNRISIEKKFEESAYRDSLGYRGTDLSRRLAQSINDWLKRIGWIDSLMFTWVYTKPAFTQALSKITWTKSILFNDTSTGYFVGYGRFLTKPCFYLIDRLNSRYTVAVHVDIITSLIYCRPDSTYATCSIYFSCGNKYSTCLIYCRRGNTYPTCLVYSSCGNTYSTCLIYCRRGNTYATCSVYCSCGNTYSTVYRFNTILLTWFFINTIWSCEWMVS